MQRLKDTETKDRLFDTWPESYDQWFTTPLGRLIREYETGLILELLRPEPGERILDAGCGTGVFTLDILSLGAHVVGLDIQFEEESSIYTKQIYSSATKLPFSDREFDFVVSVDMLGHLQKDQRIKAIKEILRVARRKENETYKMDYGLFTPGHCFSLSVFQ